MDISPGAFITSLGWSNEFKKLQEKQGYLLRRISQLQKWGTGVQEECAGSEIARDYYICDKRNISGASAVRWHILHSRNTASTDDGLGTVRQLCVGGVPPSVLQWHVRLYPVAITISSAWSECSNLQARMQHKHELADLHSEQNCSRDQFMAL
jgi:hypothetical protein